jgi:uncharacterized membrane-anchored protein
MIMRSLQTGLFALTLALSLPAALSAETMADMAPEFVESLDAGYQDLFGKLQVHRGVLAMPGGVYTLNLGENYYAMTGPDANWILETVWGNLPDLELGALIFQKGTTPLDEDWAVAVYNYADGHISDEEAGAMDFDGIIQSRKDSDADLNRQRREAGIGELTTIGLAGTPGYDRDLRALRFSVLLSTTGQMADILNANAWVLSRHGFALMNVLGTPDQAAAVDRAMPDLIKVVSFTDGNRYDDFVPGVDTVAEGGLSALLGGGMAQAGLIVLVLAFLKKGGILLLAVPFIWLKNKLFGKKPTV